MKKLALAPAVAIAITGLAASPVIAAPEAPASVSYAHSVVKNSGDSQESTSTESPETEAQAIEAKVTTSPKEITAGDLANKEKGVVVTVTGLEAGDKISDSLTGEAGVAEGDTFEYNIYSTQPAEDIQNGKVDFSVTITRDGEEETYDGLSFTVVDDTDEPSTPAVDPKVSLNTDKISQSDFNKNGIEVTGEGFTPGGKVTVVGGGAQSAFATEEVTADDEGKVSATLKFEGEGDLPAGEYSVWGVDQESDTNSEPQTFTLTEEEETEDPTTPAAEAKLSVSPETITPADFVKEDKGVTLAVENCEPGEDVRFLVNPKGESNVTAFDKTVKADDEGKANVNVYGTSASNASAYIGDYDVTVTCGDDELTGEFAVEKDPNAGGGDGDEDGNDDGNGGNDDGDNGNGGGDLPRTGTELTGLVGGAGLLLIGGVAVAMTMRRKKVAQDPAEI
ncbi:LPXTG cell wall anchor domain-containing protein [Brevibacterium spongiae]|uniref:LPXTG cell wall anchor domain-containing protein n=1 Tax=Brevibacterium spongiae TaxID=2909672 RepID=A0ABY5SP46_9MICO|nr:LPXTG cell wall anchor domain-containing protein [Brevibacterium spongiae]UVI35666.1 LPXTG cell wall anchor domain-containing protein [Brevibacterium spongiae]